MKPYRFIPLLASLSMVALAVNDLVAGLKAGKNTWLEEMILVYMVGVFILVLILHLWGRYEN